MCGCVGSIYKTLNSTSYILVVCVISGPKAERHSRWEEEHGQKQGGRIGHDMVISVMLVKHPSIYSANIPGIASTSRPH